MNEYLFRQGFARMDTSEKLELMNSLATRYDMTFRTLQTFDRWGQSCTTGIFVKDGREFVFVPGDTVTLGWERFAVGLNPARAELFVSGMGDRARSGGVDSGKHGSCSRGCHCPHVGGAKARGALLGTSQYG